MISKITLKTKIGVWGRTYKYKKHVKLYDVLFENINPIVSE